MLRFLCACERRGILRTGDFGCMLHSEVNAPMGILYSCDRQKGIIFIVWDGIVTWDDWREHIYRIQADPDWHACSRLIADLHSVTDASSIGLAEVDQAFELFASDPAILRGKRGAAVVADTFGRASRLGERVTRLGTTLVVFNNLDTACTFLGIDLTEALGTIEQLRSELRSLRS